MKAQGQGPNIDIRVLMSKELLSRKKY